MSSGQKGTDPDFPEGKSGSVPLGCPLCGPAPTELLWETPQLRVIAVPDSPFPGFIRVIWRAHAAEMSDLAPVDRDTLMGAVWAVETLQRDLLQPDKINVASLGNQVPHLHWHVIPRWRDDPCFPESVWTTVAADAQREQTWQARLPGIMAKARTLHEKIAAW